MIGKTNLMELRHLNFTVIYQFPYRNYFNFKKMLKSIRDNA
ncbi:MAG: hypothetical protein CH6_1397 [Candidatus Kapaibacterium sp.]|nr:MAG: hypothetical protein CH6_1397 [Candidatus Kapabacteria bacterium]